MDPTAISDEPPAQPMTLQEMADVICDKIREPRTCEHCGRITTSRIVARAQCMQATKEIIIAVSMHEVTNMFREKGIDYRMYVQANSQLFFRFSAPGAI